MKYRNPQVAIYAIIANVFYYISHFFEVFQKVHWAWMSFNV